MSPESFCYWLKGAIELGNFSTFDEHQVQAIQDHLDLVFKKVTPQYQFPINTPPQLPIKLYNSQDYNTFPMVATC